MTPRLAAFLFAAALGALPVRAAADDLRIAFGDPVSSLDPQLNNHAGDHSVAQHFWSRMVRQLSNGTIVPDLAEEWKNTGPTTWEFKLRKNAVWTDGKPVTAEDLVFSYNRVMTIPGSVASYKGFLRTVEKVEAKDPHTIVITTRGPDPILPISLSSLYIVSKHVGEGASTEDYNSGKAMVSSGFYAWTAYTPGDRIEMKRNDRFWGEKAAWEKVSYRYVANPAARTAALLAGDVDVIDKVSVSDIEKLGRESSVKVWSYPGLRVLVLQPSFNPEPSRFMSDASGQPLAKNPLLDVKVREALNIAINRQAVADRIMRGGATVASQWMPEGTFGYDPDTKSLPFDANRAKALLAEAGYPNGFRLTMHVPGERYPLAPEVAQAIAQFWTRIGVQTQVEVVPFSVYVAAANRNEYAMSMVGWGNGTGEGTYAMTSILATPNKEKGLGASNWGRYSSPGLDAALQAASVEMDAAKREAIIRDAVKIVTKEVGVMPLFHYKNIWASRTGLKVVPWHSDRTVAMQVSKSQ